MSESHPDHEVRLVAMRFIHGVGLIAPDRTKQREAWESAITTEDRNLAIRSVEAHAAFAPDHELDRLRILRDKLHSAFEDSP